MILVSHEKRARDKIYILADVATKTINYTLNQNEAYCFLFSFVLFDFFNKKLKQADFHNVKPK